MFDGRWRNQAKTPFINWGNNFSAGFVDAFSAIDHRTSAIELT
jgi:hypothetical protein